MEKWLLNRLFDHNSQPTPRFAYQSTVNWMAALAIICKDEDYSSPRLSAFYSKIQRRPANLSADTIAFENILMAIHNLASLEEFSKAGTDHVAIVRSAIIAWYYAVYYACSAMVAAASGTKQETHAATGKAWQSDLVRNGLIPEPFGFYLDTLIAKEVKSKMAIMRDGNTSLLVEEPCTLEQAWGAAYSYVSGTAQYERLRIEERVKSSKEFKVLGVADFRTLKAREVRDAQLRSGTVNFLVQAFRYRGKANYRDSIYLSYGEDRSESMRIFSENLRIVAESFLKIACYYTSCRVEKGTWHLFTEDLKAHLKIEFNFQIFS